MLTKPLIFYEGKYTDNDLKTFQNSKKIWKILDIYERQLDELFLISKIKKDPKVGGNWVFYPWSGALIHMVNEADLFTIRTNRNKDLITLEEQEKLYNFSVAIAGLSIGNSAALSLVYGGISKTLKIADFDILETSNLNRIRAGLQDVGFAKIQITSQQIYDTNPYAQLFCIETGLKSDTLDLFIGKPKPQIILEAIDDFEMKIRIRMAAKKAGIPVVMMTNLGDRMMVDVERYDIEKNLEIFNGLIGKTSEEILSKLITEEDKQKYAVSIVGKENVPKRALDSLPKIGKTLVGRPQLMSTVTISGAFASYIVRQIALGKNLTSGRKILNFAEIMGIEE